MSREPGSKNTGVRSLLSPQKLLGSGLTLVGVIWFVGAGQWVGVVIVLALGLLLLLRPNPPPPTSALDQKLAFLTRELQSIILNPDRQAAIRHACVAATTIGDAQAAVVYLYQRQKGTLDLECELGLPADRTQQWASVPYAAYSEPVVVRSANSSDDMLAPLASEAGFLTYLALPIRHEQLDIGLLVLFYTETTDLPMATVDLLRLLTAQFSAYLDNQQLFSVLEEYAFEMTQLTHLSRITTSSMQMERVLGDVSAMLCDMIDARQVTIGLLDAERLTLRLYQSSGARELSLDALPEIKGMISGGQPFPALLKPGAGAISSALAPYVDQSDGVRIGVFPMRANDQLLGIMLVSSSRIQTYEDREWEFVELATNQIAAQVQNVLVYLETRTALHRRLEQLSLIEDVARQISGTLDFDLIIDHMLEAALQATQGDSAALTLAEADDLWTVIQRESGGESHRTYRSRRRQDSAVEQVIRSRKPLLVNDTRAISEYVPSSRTPSLSLVAVPLIDENTVIGVLNVESATPRFFNTDQLSFLNSLAGHTVISIRNARLLEEHQYQISTLRSLQALTLRLSSAVTTQAVVEAVVETARDMLGAQEAALFRYDDERSQLLPLMIPGGRRADVAIATSEALLAAQSGDIQVAEKVTSKQSGTFVHMPIKYDGAVREVLSLAFAEDRPVRQRDLNSIVVLASQTAGHLENAMLHEHIRAGSDRMRAILNSTRDGILLIDRNGFLVECNPSAERLLGIDKDEFLGKHFVLTLSRIMGGDEIQSAGYSRKQLVSLARQLRLEPERITSRQFSRTVGTQQMYIEEIGSPVLNHRNEIVGRLLVLRDITEQKQLEVYRDEITHMAVHDLRGPLWAVISGITLAQEDMSLLPETELTRKTLGIAAQSASGLLKLVDSLMDISKLESRQMPLAREPVIVDELIASALAALSGTVDEADIEFEVDIDEGLAPLNIDAAIIQRVLVNLVDNAIRHTPAGGKIQVLARHSENDVVFYIADSGPGIPAGERDRIFERFRQVKTNIPLRGPKGSGLGLTFCKLAIEAHGGHIWVEDNSPLGGACFGITLPTVAVPAPTTITTVPQQ